MAKENYVLLIGAVQESPMVNEEKGKGRVVIQTLRRNDKIDLPVISALDDTLVQKLKTLTAGEYILVKGILATNEVKKGVICPNCNEKTKSQGTTTEIIAIEIIPIGSQYELNQLKEVSNNVMLLGSLCRDPEFRLLSNTGVPSAQYQIAVNRKYTVKKQQSSYSDYPWVNSFGKQAEQDAIRLQTGSQVFINGGLQTRNIQKNMECEHCSTSFKAEDHVAEIVPYSVEYLNNCKFE